MRKPNLFIVGAPRCGTTSLWSYLSGHPEIFMSLKKELYFFDIDLPGRQTRSIEEYMKHFAGANDRRIIGESTPTYLRSARAPASIKDFSPQAKIIIMLRNPVDLMYSLHGDSLCDTSEPIADFETALEADRKRTGVESVGYRQFADFPEAVARYFDVFGREKVRVIIFDDLRADTAGVFQSTLRFLGVDPNFKPPLDVLNSARPVKSPRLQITLMYPPPLLRRAGRAVLPRRFRAQVQGFLLSLNRPKNSRPPMDPKLRKRLQAEFQPKIERLSTMLDRDLSSWCTD